MTTRHRICIVISVALVAFVCQEQRMVSAGDAVGSLLVESDPAGASVYVDGRLAGETPLTLPSIVSGEHRVRIVRLGYLENSQIVKVKPAERATVRARLTDPAPQTAAKAALRIVVIEGEGAVNIIQQKTAVAPVIEVRDRNDQPVAGAAVRFAIQKGRASFNGVRTLTTTTNALGRATATGLTPIGGGPLQIGASAAFQGQTAALTIAQTNVLTAAQASAAAAGGGGTAGGGGGLSHLAIAGIAGGAGAGVAGALIATKSSDSSGSSGITQRTLTGPFSGQQILTSTTTFASGNNSCASARAITGTFTIQLEERADGSVTGNGSTTGTRIEQPPFCGFAGISTSFNYNGPITGTTGTVTWSVQTFAAQTTPTTVNSTHTLAFTGTLANGIITGTLSFSETFSGTNATNGSTSTGSGSTTFAVTLR
jgi:hypothetical protein